MKHPITLRVSIPLKDEQRVTIDDNKTVEQLLQHLSRNKIYTGVVEEQIVMMGGGELKNDMPLHWLENCLTHFTQLYNMYKQQRVCTRWSVSCIRGATTFAYDRQQCVTPRL